MVRDRFLSFALVLVIGFLLLVSLVISATLDAISTRVSGVVPDQFQWLQLAHSVGSLLLISLLFAMIYKILPDATVAWRNVWLGALVAATLFVVGKKLFGLYLGHSTIGSSYGAAGSLVIVVLWTYYSAIILLFGAEMTQVQARLQGERIKPTEHAVILSEHERLQQGISRTVDVAIASEEQDLAKAGVLGQADPVPGDYRSKLKPGLRQLAPLGLGLAIGWLLSKRRGRR